LRRLAAGGGLVSDPTGFQNLSGPSNRSRPIPAGVSATNPARLNDVVGQALQRCQPVQKQQNGIVLN